MDTHLYIRQLFDHINKQQQEINDLRDALQLLTKDVNQLKEKPAVTVERLEYNFDQLKVDTLEGTLNIGLNRNDLNQLDDLAIPATEPTKNQLFLRDANFKNIILDKLSDYINNDFLTVISDTEAQTGKRLHESYTDLIKKDIKKQLPARMDHYIHQLSSQPLEDMTEEQLQEKIYQSVVTDIDQAVHAFITQLPHHGKGNDQDGT